MKTKNTVTMQGILDKITGVSYTLLPNGRTTICQLSMANGFSIEGTSACVDAANYSRADGEKYAYEDALSRVWAFEGYLLAEKINKPFSDIFDATGILREQLRANDDYAWGWHCAIAMSSVNAGASQSVSNEAAARFMEMFFKIDTRAFSQFTKTVHPGEPS
jgi:hypothetical protein